ncbi:inositol monophosphatase family protein [Bacillus sp. FJAT-50079]|uniref:inositol monophosphatase family protein n=1 Tax=Bacillus sp. FJAT-50079 TaxID=2833577 RepID=UPI001BC8E181|nr:inositol monophosphatase family protein [Bacillus sp. FJAT-50079]MBS4207768.1 inositol monophosphatase family protein [Bacillus sp. FJAT-50079]
MTSWTKVDSLTKEWLREAGATIIASFSTTLNIQTKANANDLVTNLDKETEQFFTEKIKKNFPEHRILGEEGFGDEVKDLQGIVWIIDPIDGTMNFVHQQRNFFISIGIYENGVGKLGYLYDVVHGELYYAQAGEGAYWDKKKLPPLTDGKIEEAVIGLSATWLASNRHLDVEKTLIPLVNDVRSTRSYGSAALEFAYVATGRLDSYINMRLAPWDFAGGKIIVEELGGVVTNLKGEPVNLLETGPVIIARPGLHEKIMNYIKK